MQNMLPSEAAAVAGVIDPDAIAVGPASSAWVDMGQFDQIMAVALVGTLGAAATADAKLEQALDATGSGAKDIPGKAIAQVAVSDVQAVINCRAEELDIDAGFRFARLTITIGAAASDAGGVVLGFGPRYAPASDLDLASVAEIVA